MTLRLFSVADVDSLNGAGGMVSALQVYVMSRGACL